MSSGGSGPTVTTRADYADVQRLCAEPQRVTAMLTLGGPVLEHVEDRKGALRLSIAVDVSGSMRGERLGLAIETLQFVVGELTAADELGIIAYDTQVYERLPPTRMDADGKVRARGVAAALRAGSSTNLSGGLFAAVDQVLGRTFSAEAYGGPEEPQMAQHAQLPVQRSSRGAAPVVQPAPAEGPQTSAGAACPPAEPRSVDAGTVLAALLLTDGHANHGLQTAEAIIPELLRAHVGTSNVAVHTFGFGSNHNADLLRAIGEATQGTYYFVEVAEQIKEAFGNCLGGLVSVVMQRIRVRCAPGAAGVRVVRALTKYPAAQHPDGSVEVRMSDLYSGETRDTLVELEVAAQAEQSGGTVIAVWRVEYDDSVAGERGRALEATTEVRFAEEVGRGAADLRVDEQRRRLDVVEAMEDARTRAAAGGLEEARGVLQRAQQSLASAPSAAGELARGLALECTTLERALTSRHEWEAKGSKMASMAMQRHAQQRSNTVSAEECGMYSTPHQMSMKQKAGKK